MAWNKHMVVLAARGTSSMQNALSDIQVMPARAGCLSKVPASCGRALSCTAPQQSHCCWSAGPGFIVRLAQLHQLPNPDLLLRAGMAHAAPSCAWQHGASQAARALRLPQVLDSQRLRPAGALAVLCCPGCEPTLALQHSFYLVHLLSASGALAIAGAPQHSAVMTARPQTQALQRKSSSASPA